MPELPEVETVRRGLQSHVAGRVVDDSWAFPHPKFAPAVEIVGSRLVEVRRRGKFLLVDLDGDRELIIHLGMTGSLVVDGASAGTHVRAWWRLDDSTTLVFSDIRRFGRLRVVDAGDYSSVPTLAAMGPEPLDEAFTADDFHRRIRASSRAIKTQLLSQRPVAGVGNIYADEALWAAGIDPSARRLSRSRAARLRSTIVDVLSAGVANGGTTLRDYRTSDGSEGEHQHHLRCYGRFGAPCERCGTVLRRKVVDARTTTWCPICQRR